MRVLLVLAGLACSDAQPPPGFEQLERLPTRAATQGVAVGPEHVYAIGTRRIEKLERRTGRRVAAWEAGEDRRIVHLNGGIVVDGELWCAHSNYPALPMQSQVVRFDAADLSLRGIEPLPWAPGSLTWFDRRGELWWFAFAHYAGRGGAPGRGPEATRLVARNADGSPGRALAFPPEAIARFGRYSTSGGGFGAAGLLYVTGHDAAEVYALRIPEEGDTLEWVGAFAAPIAGQGIAWDAARRELWGIHRARRELRRMTPP